MKTSDKVLVVTAIIAAVVVYVGGHLAYNEENYAMTVTTSDGHMYAVHEPGWYWVGWGARTDRYKKEIAVEFKGEEKPLTEYQYETEENPCDFVGGSLRCNWKF